MFDAVILAAGVGKRMKSSIPKILHCIDDVPMICYLIKKIIKVKEIGGITVVVGKDSDAIVETIKKHFQNDKVNFAVQSEPLGTGHALSSGINNIEKLSEAFFVFCGDMPLISAETIKSMIDIYNVNQPDAVVLTAVFDNPFGYGRIIRNKSGEVIKIVEEKDATEEERKTREINSGIYIFKSAEVINRLNMIKSNNNQKEYYLTDIIEILNNEDKKVIPFVAEDVNEICGINSRQQLAFAEEIRRNKKIDRLMKSGVTFEDISNVYISDDSVIGRDTIIEPGVIIKGESNIGQNCRIGAYCILKDANISDGMVLAPYTKKE